MKRPILINLHLHSTGSDGKMTSEEVVREAINSGIKFICFTDHYPQPYNVKQNRLTDKFFSEDYVREIERLREEYADKIDISLGVELEFMEGYEDWARGAVKKYDFDYIVGSVHDLLKDGKSFGVSSDSEEGKKNWLAGAKKFGSVENFVKEYYRLVCLTIKSGLFDSIGHLDIIKMYNRKQDLFQENSDWYKKGILSCLDNVAEAGMALEINLRGLIKSPKEQYPSLWILKEARKRNIPITIGTDAHRVGQVAENLDSAYELAREAGYKEIVRFKARKRISIPIV